MKAKYILDSNIFISLQRRQPIDVFPSVWAKINELMQNGIIISSQEVYDEIQIGDDALSVWAKARNEFFIPTDENIQATVREILSKNRGLVEGGSKKNNADPFIIAIAKMNNCTVVSDETRTNNSGSPKIPDICDQMEITCISFISFLRELKLTF